MKAARPDTNREERVRVSNEFGLLHFERVDVPRPSPDYGWDGESLKDFRRTDQQIHDDRLQQRVVEALSVDLNLDLSHVDVFVNDGHVNLAGVLNDPAMIERAGQLVSSLPGVKSVRNELT